MPFALSITMILSLLLMINVAQAITPTEMGLKHPEMAYVYQQPAFMKEDILGDLLLSHSLKTASVGLLHILAGKRSEFYSKPYIEAYRLARLYPKISRTNFEVSDYLKTLPENQNYYVLDLEEIKSKFRGVLDKGPSYRGSFPNWSQKFKTNYRSSLMPAYPSKLLACLIRGVCARFMLTGHEKKLEAWGLKRKDQSITPEILFFKALQFSEGDVTQALLTCNNTLSWYSKAPNRHLTPLQAKLRPFITTEGDISEDKFGEWYHFFGLMTYGFVKGAGKAGFIGFTESVGGRILTKFEPEVIEETVNHMAPKIGSYLSESF